MPESHNSPFSLNSPHTDWSRDRKPFCLLSTDEFADTGLLSEMAHLHGALLCCAAISIIGTWSTFARKLLYSTSIFTFAQLPVRDFFLHCYLSSPTENQLESHKTFITKKDLQFSFHFQSAQKHKISDKIRLTKALLAFSGPALLRMKPTVSHFEIQQQKIKRLLILRTIYPWGTLHATFPKVHFQRYIYRS